MNKHKRKNNKVIRSDLSGRVVNGKAVIFVDEAEDYLKKCGYYVESPRRRALKYVGVAMLFMFIFTMYFIYPVSATPFIQNNVEGIQISNPVQETYPANTTLIFPYHIYNLTTSSMLDNTTTMCSFHLINSTGEHIFIDNFKVPYNTTEMTFEQTINANNYTAGENYSNSFYCNSSSIGGFSFVTYHINLPATPTPTNTLLQIDFSQSISLIAVILSIVIAIIFFITDHRMISGSIIGLVGLIMSMNGVNIILSGTFIILGVVLLITGDDKKR